ncbi:hypothetical protein P4O66_001908 [Electrophorus voltai]|uniref:CCHC-type domain-containing protein n=1 Tax=Electrophorus voltai TaxID=2609070 RepID=A0AAD8Z390_9TELE|nr:hypothetical protein P4O66_001908 [Electrophorus voltai]
MATFHQGLSKDLKHELVHRDTPASLNHLIDLVLRINNRVRQRHRTWGPEISRGSRGAPYPLSPVHVPSKQGESRSQPMQLGHTRLSRSECDARMREERCLYCGSSGHLHPACPELQGKDNICQEREDQSSPSPGVVLKECLKHVSRHSCIRERQATFSMLG